MFGRNLEPTANDIIGAMADGPSTDPAQDFGYIIGWHDPQPLDISRYGTATQERIVSVNGSYRAQAVTTRAIALAQAVREAEDRAAVRLAADATARRLLHEEEARTAQQAPCECQSPVCPLYH